MKDASTYLTVKEIANPEAFWPRNRFEGAIRQAIEFGIAYKLLRQRLLHATRLKRQRRTHDKIAWRAGPRGKPAALCRRMLASRETRDLIMDQGAHFHKCDFQAHTPRDLNWEGAGAVTDAERIQYAQDFVAACREKGLEAVAITDTMICASSNTLNRRRSMNRRITECR